LHGETLGPLRGAPQMRFGWSPLVGQEAENWEFSIRTRSCAALGPIASAAQGGPPVETWPIRSWALATLLLNSSCLSAVGQPATDGGDAGVMQAGCGDAGACSVGETCDALDGVCRCGPQAGDDAGLRGTICGPKETCDPVLHTCIATICYMVLCTGGNECDLQDGICKCGGLMCPSSQICDVASHTCQ
jgi:hypothetical protein